MATAAGSGRFSSRNALSGLLVLATLLAGLGPRPSLATDGRELLSRIGLTAVEKTYSGDKIVIDFSNVTPQVTKMSILHQLGGREKRFYQGTRSVVIVDGGFFYHYHPDRRLLIKKKLPGEGGYDALRRENLKQTLISYEMRHAPSDTIAGRRTHLYEFLPRGAGTRPVRKVWVDVETGLILKMEVYSPDNRLFWLSAYEKIDYEPRVTPSSFSMEIPSGVRVVETDEVRCLTTQEAEDVAGVPIGLPEYLPDGFAQKCVRARRTGDYGEIQIVYSDGLSLLSLFESSRFRPVAKGARSSTQPVTVGDRQAELHRLGLVHALAWQTSWVHLTILGEISREEMLRVAESIYPLRELSRP